MDLKEIAEQELKKKVITLTKNGHGMLNNAFLIQSEDGKKYILKSAREDAEESVIYPLATEAAILQKLNHIDPTLPVPKVMFVKSAPDMYCYEYIEGGVMIDSWNSLTSEEKINVCTELGEFHSRLGKNISKQDAINFGVDCNENPELPKKVREDYYEKFLLEDTIPDKLKEIARRAYKTYNSEREFALFQFIHSDSHQENIILKDKKLSAIIDFGDCEYTDVHQEFSYYVRQIPDFFEYIVNSYENSSGNKVSRLRLVSWALLWDLEKIRYYLTHSDSSEESTEKKNYINPSQRIKTYEMLLNRFS